MARGGPLCHLRRASHVSPMGSRPAFCVSLGVMPCEDCSLGMRTSNGVRPSSVSNFYCHVFAMLIPFHNTRLSRDPLRNTHRTITAASPFNHHQSSLSSHASQPTRHRLGTPLQRSLPFLVPFFLASGLPCYLFISPVSDTFVLPTQWGMSCSHLFAGKTVRSADLPALRLSVYPRA
jgi:hypothetical protein